MSLQRQKIVSLDGDEYTVTFRKVKRAKVMRITLSASRITVTGPFFVPFFALEKFWESKKKWALENKTLLQTSAQGPRGISKERFLAIRNSAESLVAKKLDQWNRVYDFQWNRVTIRNQKTRFGSCSAQRNLSFHACIIDLPVDLQDYLVVHELCHLQEMNHSQEFWKLVAKSIPDPRARATELAQWQRGN